MRQKVVGIGEVLWDIFPEGKKLGGAPANFAYHMAQLGLDSVVVSAIGDDQLGHEIIENFESKNIIYHLEKTGYPTGTVNVEVDKQGIPQYIITENVAWDNIQYTSDLKKLAHSTSCVSFGSLSQRSEVTRNTLLCFLDDMEKDTYRIFDINLRQHFYSKEVLDESFSRCNVLKLNEEELVVISEIYHVEGNIKERCRKLLSLYGWKLIILTCGGEGSWLFTTEKNLFRETPKVDVVDTVGAGDSFTASLFAAVLKGYSLDEAHRIATDIAAYVCTQSGAMPILPNSLKF